jgi:hypothetical protein
MRLLVLVLLLLLWLLMLLDLVLLLLAVVLLRGWHGSAVGQPMPATVVALIPPATPSSVVSVYIMPSVFG